MANWGSPSCIVTIESNAQGRSVAKNQEILDSWSTSKNSDDDAITTLLGSSGGDNDQDEENVIVHRHSPEERRVETREQVLQRYKSLFITWCAMAMQRDHWVKLEKLPSMFRFALQRPLLPESVLQACTKIIGLTEKLDALWTHDGNFGSLDREIQRSIYVDPNPGHHVSGRFRDVLPFGLESLKDGSDCESEAVESAEPAVGEILINAFKPYSLKVSRLSVNTALHQLYEDIEAGKVPLVEASQRYAQLVGRHPQTSQALAKLLVSRGLLANHIPRNGSVGRIFGSNTGQKVQYLFREIEDQKTIKVAEAKLWYERVLGQSHNLSFLADRLFEYGLPSSHLEGRYERDVHSDESLLSEDLWPPRYDTELTSLPKELDEDRELIDMLEEAIVEYRAESMEFDDLFKTFREVFPGLPYDDIELSEILTDLESSPQEIARNLLIDFCDQDLRPRSDQSEGKEPEYQESDISFSPPRVPSVEEGPTLSYEEKDLMRTVAKYIDIYREGKVDAQSLFLVVGKDLPGFFWTDEYLYGIMDNEKISSKEIARFLVIQALGRSSHNEHYGGREEQAFPRTRDSIVDLEEDIPLSALSAIIEAFRSSQIDVAEAIRKINDHAGISLESNWLVDRLIDDRLTTKAAAKDITEYLGLGSQVPPEVGYQVEHEIPEKKQRLHLRPPKKLNVSHAHLPTPAHSRHVSIEAQAYCNRGNNSRGNAPGTPPHELEMQSTAYKQHLDDVPVPTDDGSLHSQSNVENSVRSRTFDPGDAVREIPDLVHLAETYRTSKKSSEMPPPSISSDNSLHHVCGSPSSRSRREGAPTPEQCRVMRCRSGTPRPELPQMVIPTISETATLELRRELSRPEMFRDLGRPAQPNEWKSFMSGSAGNPISECYDPSYTSTSPEDCTTDDLFGIEMSTKEALNIGHKLELPPEFIQERIRSKTPNRLNYKKMMKVNSTVTLPSPKRQASRTLSEEHCRTSSKLDTIDNQFALDGEDSYAFIRRRFTPALIDRAISFSPRPNKKKKRKKTEKKAALQTLFSSFKIPLKSHVPSTEPATISAVDTSSDVPDVPGLFDSIDTDLSNQEKPNAKEVGTSCRSKPVIIELPNDESLRQPMDVTRALGSVETGTGNLREISHSPLSKSLDDQATDRDNCIRSTLPQSSENPLDGTCSEKCNSDQSQDQGSILASYRGVLEKYLEKYHILEREESLISTKIRRSSATLAGPDPIPGRRAMATSKGEKEMVALDEDLVSCCGRWREVRTFANDKTIGRYFSSTSGGITTQSTALNRMFDKYRGTNRKKPLAKVLRLTQPLLDDPKDSPDLIGVTGTMHYLTDLNVPLDQVIVLAVLAELQAPTMGELTRQGFTDCWTRYQ